MSPVIHGPEFLWGSGVPILACIKSPGGLAKTESWPIPKVSDSVGLGWGSKMCVSNNFPGDDGNTTQKQHSRIKT